MDGRIHKRVGDPDRLVSIEKNSKAYGYLHIFSFVSSIVVSSLSYAPRGVVEVSGKYSR